MADEKVITLREFKVVMEGVDSKLRKIVEVMDFRFGKIDERFGKIDEQFGKIDEKFNKIDERFDVLEEQIGLLHEGQTEIRAELRAGLKDKVSYSDFTKLEKRVARLEHKSA